MVTGSKINRLHLLHEKYRKKSLVLVRFSYLTCWLAYQPHPRFQELLAQWRREAPLGPEDELSEIPDQPIRPEDLL